VAPNLEYGVVRRFPMRREVGRGGEPGLPHGTTCGGSLATGCRGNRVRWCGVAKSRPSTLVRVVEMSRGSSEANTPGRRPPNKTCTPRGVRERAIWSNRRGPFGAGVCGRGVRPRGGVVEEAHAAGGQTWRFVPTGAALSPSPRPLPRLPGCSSPDVVLRERGHVRGGAAASWDKFENLSGLPWWDGMRRAQSTVARVPCPLTPSLSRVHPGAVHRASFRGRGGTCAAGPRVSRRSDSPTPARRVGSWWMARVVLR